jgi:hypothetical protein
MVWQDLLAAGVAQWGMAAVDVLTIPTTATTTTIAVAAATGAPAVEEWVQGALVLPWCWSQHEEDSSSSGSSDSLLLMASCNTAMVVYHGLPLHMSRRRGGRSTGRGPAVPPGAGALNSNQAAMPPFPQIEYR